MFCSLIYNKRRLDGDVTLIWIRFILVALIRFHIHYGKAEKMYFAVFV